MSSSRAAADSYLRSLDTQVQAQLQVDGRPAVVLEQTCFYPEGGGQPFDTGTIAGVTVLAVQTHADGTVVHTLAQSLPAGAVHVTASIDWARRFDHMQQHSGQHILSQSFLQIAGAATAGFHLSAQRVTIDLQHAAFSAEQLAQVEQLANSIVQSNLPVRVSFPGPAEVRPSHISLVPSNDDDLELAVTVEVAEISGSETFLHVRNEHFLLVLHLPGVHEYDVDAPIRIYIPTHKLFVFDAQGRLVQAPGRRIARVA